MGYFTAVGNRLRSVNRRQAAFPKRQVLGLEHIGILRLKISVRRAK